MSAVESNNMLIAALKANPKLSHFSNEELKLITINIQSSIRDDIIKQLGITFELLPMYAELYWKLHSTKLYEIIVNLRDEPLGAMIANDPLISTQIGKLTYRDYNPEPTQKLFEMYVQLNDVAENKQASELYNCSKCGSPMYVREMSNRSADEQQAVELTCKNCGNRAII